MKKERVEYLDALRTLAAIAVVMLHVAANRWYHVPVRSFEFQFMNLVNGLVRWSTPVFVMISGAVFLNRDISVKALFCKYLPRLVTVYLFWVVLYNASAYCPFLNPQNRQVFTLGVFVKQALLGYSDMWFLPMLMGLDLNALLGSQAVAIPVMTVTVALASFAVSAVLNHIPVVRRWLV